MFAIIDIETCGGRFEFKKGRITEICIIIHDGLQVVDKFTTLINPECYINPYFVNISGITNEMVADAPRFHEVARKIMEMTEGKIFVAHNVGFDYGFIRDEFASLGAVFRRETLCTVRLSRKLIPNRISYSLGHLCASLGIEIDGRHRAEGDAVATAKLFDLLLALKNDNPQYKNKGVDELMTRRIDKIKQYILNKLPEECGVYYFLNKEGEVIYVGKSKNVYNRAMSHFNSTEKKGKKMLNELYNVDFVPTGSELIALLLESEEIKKRKPKYNRARKSEEFTHAIDYMKDRKGIHNFKIVATDEAENPILSFNTYTTARERLNGMIDDYTLCLRYCGLTSDEAVCFNHQIKQCNGICCGEESIEDYNKRAEKALEKYLFKEPDFIIVDKGRHEHERSVIVIENRKFKAYGYFETFDAISSAEELKGYAGTRSNYPDATDIVRSWMEKQAKVTKVVF